MDAGARRGVSLRVALGALLSLVAALALALFCITIVQLRTAEGRNDAERRRVSSFLLADQMRRSSDDLTRMVRLYVTTGRPAYRSYYDRILQIRRGTAPRPLDYDGSFWDRVLADGYARVRTGPAVSLPELMRRARFSREDFAALQTALRVSDRLARREVATMDAVAPEVARAGPGGLDPRDVAPQYAQLVDGAYHREKRRILTAIDRFTQTVDRRTADRAAVLQVRTDRLLVAQTVALVLLGLVLALLLTVAGRAVVRPLERLTAVTRRITGGDWSAHARREGVREVRELADDFEAMTAAVQRELRAREQVEREATEARGRLQTIADGVPGSVFQFHVDRHDALSVRFASRDSSVHGIPTEDGVHFPAVARAVLPDDRGSWLDSLVAARRAGDTWQREYRIATPDGRTAWMHGHALVRRTGDGEADLYGYIADVTAQKKLEAELLRAREAAEGADRAKSAFLAAMSHELRTPLVAVTGTLEVLALGELEEQQRERVAVAARSARALLAVIGDVLDFSKIEAGHLELDPAPASLARIVRETVAQHAHAAERRGLTLEAVVAEDLAPAHEVDAVRLGQVLGNLVGNALKFTPSGGVRVVARPVAGPGAPDGEVELLVVDTGIGVSPADRARLFAPFSQAGADAVRRGEGTGLGLVISRELVDAMGGTLAMESREGTGTTMRVRLRPPVAAVEDLPAGPVPEVARRPRPTREEAVAEGGLVLLVEDHPVNRAVLAAQIEAVGVVVDVAEDATEALRRFRADTYGLVLTDIRLPGADGYELTTRLRAHEADAGRRRTPVVALTASAVRGEAERCRAAGMDDLVTKPTTIAVLEATLRRHLPHLAWPSAAGPDGASAAPGSADGARPPAGALLDPSALDELTGGDADLGREVLATYLATLGGDVDALRAATVAGDAAGAGHVAHRMGSAARMVGATAVADAAEGLEAALHAGAPGWSPLADAVTRAAEALRPTS
ncbi:ATP-binding protein [Patulibacter sp.]|uniref:hybrid sensor histidine kinase/response regulator n=1 Tax=Patulibacter sp. TaxID=1912859 RepID=UPI002729384A|nr:ATP-binding protein [Patulibacter sp.]MDO9407100.1 response regulator [Patulibacter sp.]